MATQNNELEVLRQQLAIFNKKLEGQTIVNDRLMREAMKGKMSWIRNLVWAEIVAVPFLVILFAGMATAWHLSYWPVAFLAVMLIVSVVLDYKINIIGDRAYLQDNLADTARRLARMKRRRVINEAVMAPVAIAWAVWFLYDIYSRTPAEGEMHAMLSGGLIGGCVGVVIGGVVAVVIVRKMQKTNDAVIRQINELENDDILTVD